MAQKINNEIDCDLIVIGGGPAGVTAALRARELGASVALVERNRMGGTCTNDGCVPTRVLAHTARLLREAQQFHEYGLISDAPQLDFSRVMRRAAQVVYTMHEKKQLIGHLSDVGVRVFSQVGEAHFRDANTLDLPDGTHLQAEKFILCAGGRARRLDFPGAELALTHSDVWSLKSLPASVIIVGAAATGCQLASILAAFGAEVTLLERSDHILGNEDQAVRDVVTQTFQQRGIRIITGIESIQQIVTGEAVRVLSYTQNGQPHQLKAQAIILSTGWVGNLSSLNLPAAGVETQGHFVPVNDYLQTNQPHIFAAGDITGLCKLIVSPENHRILGVHVVGEQALEIVHMAAAGMAAGMWVEQLADLQIAYPTFTAVIGLAARKITRQLGVVPLTPEWRSLEKRQPHKPLRAEWELGNSGQQS